MADPIITNGQTVLKFKPADFVLADVPAWTKTQRLRDNDAGLPRVHTSGAGKKRIITASLDLQRAPGNGYSGYDDLYAFYENDDGTGVDGMGRTFMYTDADGDSYQVRFAEQLALVERKKDTSFTGTVQLYNEHTLPTDPDNTDDLVAWWTAYDMDHNGGDLTAWSDDDTVGATGNTDMEDKGSNGYNLTGSGDPRFKTNQINGRPAIDLDGNDRLDSNSIGALYDGEDLPWTFIAIAEHDASASLTDLACAGSSSVSDRIEFFRRDGTNDWEMLISDGATTLTRVAGTPDTEKHIISVVYTGTAVSMWVDGSNLIDASNTNTGALSGLNRFMIGAAINAGTYSSYWNGRFGEGMLFDAALTTLKRRRQELRLADMWRNALTA